MAKQLHLELANFTLRFGDKFVLLDLLDEIVIPAFTKQRERPSRGSTLLFHDVKLIDAGKDGNVFPVIAGRIVKLMTVQRQRVFDRQRGLIDEPVELESSPASFFVLVLDGHRLLYVKEEGDSPGIEAFGNTAQRFLDDSHEEYVDIIFENEKQSAKQAAEKSGKKQDRVTKKGLKERIPRPELNVIEISTRRNLAEFIEGFDKLKKASMTLVKTNDEADNDDFLAELRRRQAAINARTTSLQQSNPDGLNKKEVIAQFGAAVDGNARVRFLGTDEDDHELRGDNHQFKLKIGLHVESPRPENWSRCIIDWSRQEISVLEGRLRIAGENWSSMLGPTLRTD